MHATENPPPAQPDDDIASWLRLQHTAGVGPVAARRLLERFGLPADVFTAGFDALREVV
ncbi:MAG: DNA-protecting protein DprA, partial [Burkholderiaceae bacterium]|nr:DNA-protecting protein DprA [Burkholderiaceae bacterium]